MGTTLRTRRFPSSTRWGFKSSNDLGELDSPVDGFLEVFATLDVTEGLVTGFRKKIEYMANYL